MSIEILIEKVGNKKLIAAWKSGNETMCKQIALKLLKNARKKGDPREYLLNVIVRFCRPDNFDCSPYFIHEAVNQYAQVVAGESALAARAAAYDSDRDDLWNFVEKELAFDRAFRANHKAIVSSFS